jgi:hypothetical protein
VALLDLFAPLLNKLKIFLGPLGKLWDKIVGAWNHITHIVQATEKLVDTIKDEISAWKNFRQDIRFKSRVVQLESAFTKTRDLIEGIPESWRAILDLIKQFRESIATEQAPQPEEFAADIEEGGSKTITEIFPKLGKLAEKALGFVSIIVTALEQIANAIDDLQTIVDELKRIRLEIEKLDTIFLQQGNKRQTLKLADGKTIRIRVGRLHSAV